ncbi:MAG: hypothetical protein H8E37_02115 [Planctomycetes bacterium]|nr:hypothetical protein [Planctomycetota bacterium]
MPRISRSVSSDEKERSKTGLRLQLKYRRHGQACQADAGPRNVSTRAVKINHGMPVEAQQGGLPTYSKHHKW